MTLLTEGQHAGEFLVSEASGTRARAAVTVVAATDLAPGTVLGMVTGTGVYTAFNPQSPVPAAVSPTGRGAVTASRMPWQGRPPRGPWGVSSARSSRPSGAASLLPVPGASPAGAPDADAPCSGHVIRPPAPPTPSFAHPAGSTTDAARGRVAPSLFVITDFFG